MILSPSVLVPEVKIVLSLREEYVGELQELSAAIPGLFHERLRLAPLKEEEAREAITAPAQLKTEPGEEPYWSPRFDFDPPALDDMPLQLLCRHAEIILAGILKADQARDPTRRTRRPRELHGTGPSQHRSLGNG